MSENYKKTVEVLFDELYKANGHLNRDDLKEIHLKFSNQIKVFSEKSKIANLLEQTINQWQPSQIDKWTRVVRTGGINPEYIGEMIAVVRRAVELSYSKELRDAQLISIISLLSKKNDKGRLIQVSTGEGKTITIAALAVIKVLLGQSVDIITSSEELAIRDSKENYDFFNLFSIKVANNIEQKNPKLPKKCYKSDVVYGTTSSFQSDILNDEYKLYGTLNGRKHEAIIVDEVDSMFVDEYGTSTYLSESKPGFEKLTFVFFSIWQHLFILNKEKCNEEETFDRIANIIDLYLKKSDFLVDINQGEKSSFLGVPDYIKAFIKTNLRKWIASAIKARFDYHKGKDYLIKEGNIIPIDQENSGSIQTRTKYGNGLQQFLQLKHQLAVTNFDLVTNFLSNIGFFKRYINKENKLNNICGLTGTLGSDNCKEMLAYTYHVDFLTVPTYKLKNFKELQTLILQNEKEWICSICESVFDKVQENRAVLILAESLISVEIIKESLLNVLENDNLIVYERNDINGLPEMQLSPGKVILSTNLAGRGVDIKLDKAVIDNGGLHVCLTFLSINTRVEMQAFGRAARQGQPGSGQIILNYDSELKINNLNSNEARDLLEKRELLFQYESFLENLDPDALDFLVKIPETIEDFKLLRNEKEKKHLENAKTIMHRIEIEDILFENFCKFLKKIISNFENETEKEIMRNAIEERWAIWLNQLNKMSLKSKEEADQHFQNSFQNQIETKNENDDADDEKYKCIINANYLNSICISALKNDENKVIQFFRRPFETIKKTIIDKNKQPIKLPYDQIIQLSKRSLQIDASSFVPNMNIAVCKIIMENKKKIESIKYSDAILQFKMSQRAVEREFAFWSYFHDMLLNSELKKNKNLIEIVKDKATFFKIINDNVIKKNIKELQECEKTHIKVQEKAIITEIPIKEFLSSNEAIKEMKLRSLENVYLITKRPPLWKLAIPFTLGVLELIIGISFVSLASAFPYLVFLGPIGIGLLAEGIPDIFTGMFSLYTGELDLSEYAVKKIISIVFTVFFISCSSTKLLNSEKLFNVLKRSPFTAFKAFVKKHLGYDIKSLVFKYTGNVLKDAFLMSVSILSRKFYNKKKKLPIPEDIFNNEENKKLREKIELQITEINRCYSEMVNQMEEEADRIATTALDNRLEAAIMNNINATIEIESFQQMSENQNQENYVIPKIEDVATEAEEFILRSSEDNEDETLSVRQNFENLQESLINHLENNASSAQTININNQFIKFANEAKTSAEKNKYIEMKTKFEQNKIITREKYLKSLASEGILNKIKTSIKSKAKQNIRNKIEQMMNQDLHRINTIKFINSNAFISREQTDYAYRSLDIEHISSQLFKDQISSNSSNVQLLKPFNKETAEKVLLEVDLSKNAIIFHDIGELKWCALYLLVNGKNVKILCKSSLNKNSDIELNKSLEYIKNILKANNPEFNFLCVKNTCINENENGEEEVKAVSGIYALRNMSIILNEVKKQTNSNVFDFVNFERYTDWCKRDSIQAYRKNEYADLFGVNFLEVEFDRILKHLIKDHHKSEIEELSNILHILSSERNLEYKLKTIKKNNANDANKSKTILGEICIQKIYLDSSRNTIEYEYSYAFDLNQLENESLKQSVLDDILIFYCSDLSTNLIERSSNVIKVNSNADSNDHIKKNEKLRLTFFNEIVDNEEKEDSKRTSEESKKKEKNTDDDDNDEDENENEEDNSLFCMQTFLHVLNLLKCEDFSLNRHLATKLFSKTKFSNQNVSESFLAAVNLLSETNECFKEELAKKEKMTEKVEYIRSNNKTKKNADSEYIDREMIEYNIRRENVIKLLKESGMENPNEELIQKLLFP